MKFTCPTCRQVIGPDQINVAKDLGYCTACAEGFHLSHQAAESEKPDEVPGAWFRRERDTLVVGATTRSPIAILLVPFTLVWSGGSLGGLYGTQLVTGFDPIQTLFSLPFLIGSILLISLTLMCLFGKVEVVIGSDSYVFTGIGPLGLRRRFDWFAVQHIDEGFAMMRYPGSHGGQVILRGKKRLAFGTNLSGSRRYFVLHMLRYLKATSQAGRR